MSETQDNSSLPILLTLSAAVLVTVGAGWYLLDDDSSAPVATRAPAADVTEALTPDELAESTEIESAAAAGPPGDDAIGPSVEEAAAESSTSQTEADLRKARLAAEAEILAYPSDQSALYYYNRILEAEPQHAVAKAELDAVLARIAQIASAHMAAEEYADAHDLAVLVARRSPGHPLVQEVQQELDRLTDDYVEQAIQLAQDGKDAEVAAALQAAQALPGRNPEYFSAVQDSINNIQQSRISAEQSKLERARLAAVQATTAWVDRVRSAIIAGRLIAPAGESAIDYLAERDSPADQVAQLTEELVMALKAECTASIDNGNLASAEQLLKTLTEISADNSSDIQAIRDSLENAYVAAESNRVVTLDELVRLETAPARYPRRAAERGLEGWVEVLFTVTPTGETADIRVQQASPEEIFDKSAMEAVENWTFEPRVYRGRTLAQRAGARLVFRLQ